MDYNSATVDAIPTYTFSSTPEDVEDHVRWQGSQTACQALNQLIKSSSHAATEDVGTSRGE